MSVVIISSASVDPDHNKRYAIIAAAVKDIYKMRQSTMPRRGVG